MVPGARTGALLGPRWLRPARQQSSASSSSPLRSNSADVPKPRASNSSATIARRSSWVSPVSCARVLQPRAKSNDSKESATCAGLRWICSSSSPVRALLNQTLQAKFSRREASMASASSMKSLARVERLLVSGTPAQAASNWRNPKMLGPWPGADINQRKSLNVSALPSIADCRSAMSTTSPRALHTSSTETVPVFLTSRRSKRALRCWSSSAT
mmetsp:Transcript_25786/g.74236  ORF Transcript_25786/g.74236 Transcript_25786/m.74236 type:complete len:214 (+) Transcript_25786:649-1290(+)